MLRIDWKLAHEQAYICLRIDSKWVIYSGQWYTIGSFRALPLQIDGSVSIFGANRLVPDSVSVYGL